MQIKTTLRFYLTLGRMATIKCNNNNKCWRGCSTTGTLIHCFLVGMQISTISMENSVQIPQKSNNLSYNSVILLLGIYAKEPKTGYNRDTFSLIFITALFTIAKILK
jgi:hypothetical protein